MTIWQTFAYIYAHRIVNIASYLYSGYYDANLDAKNFVRDILQEADYDNAFAIEVTQYPVKVGDVYLNGLFYRSDETGSYVIGPIPTVEEDVASLQGDMTDVQIALVEIYEEILGG